MRRIWWASHRNVQRATIALLAAMFVAPAFAATISGAVFEDVNYGGGPGRSFAQAGGAPLANVRVELYRQSSGTFVGATTTNVSGFYSLDTTGSAATQRSRHYVRVVNGTVRSSRAASCSDCVAIQTYRTNAQSGVAVAATDRVGGEAPDLSDAPSNLSSTNFNNLDSASQEVQSVTIVDPAARNSTISNVDFGFNFDTIVNTRDAANCTPTVVNPTFYPCQGSLRQFIINSNALGGEGSLAQAGSGQLDGSTTALPSNYESSVFMIPGGDLSSGVAMITLAGALPTTTGVNTRLDAATQTVNIGNTNFGSIGSGGSVGVDNISLPAFPRPEVQLNCAASATPITLDAGNQAILGFALRQGYILLSGANGTARNNLVGMTASGSSVDNSAAAYGIAFSAPNATIRNNYVTVNNSAIRSDGGGANSVITLNEVGRPSSGHTNTFDGILLINGASNVQITANLVRDQRGGAIELGFAAVSSSYTNIRVENNTIVNNGFDSGSAPSGEPVGVAVWNVIGNAVGITRNVIADNAGAGLLVTGASGITVSQNRFVNNSGIAIDLLAQAVNPNALTSAPAAASAGVTINDSGDGDTGANGLLNYPVITSATIVNGMLSVAGYARPNSAIELYLAEADPTGFGEGQTYLGLFTEGGGADLDATTGAYGPAAINGHAQGTDTTNRFAFQIAIPPGVSAGSLLTSTATLGGQTSEFGGNVFVTTGPSLLHLKSAAVLSDPVNNAANPKSIPGAVQLYTLRITNQGAGVVDNDSLVITDAIPDHTAMYVMEISGAGSGPVAFVDSSPASALTYTFTALNSPADHLEFSNDNGSSWDYTPTPDAEGYDPAVTHIRVRLQGSMAASGVGGSPWFEIRFRVRVE